MYEMIREGQYNFEFAHDVFLDENQKTKFIFRELILENLDCEINLSGMIQVDQDGEYSDIDARGVAIFYTKDGQEVVRLYIDWSNFHKFSNAFKRAYNIDLISKIWEEIHSDFSMVTDYPTSVSDRI